MNVYTEINQLFYGYFKLKKISAQLKEGKCTTEGRKVKINDESLNSIGPQSNIAPTLGWIEAQPRLTFGYATTQPRLNTLTRFNSRLGSFLPLILMSFYHYKLQTYYDSMWRDNNEIGLPP